MRARSCGSSCRGAMQPSYKQTLLLNSGFSDVESVRKMNVLTKSKHIAAINKRLVLTMKLPNDSFIQLDLLRIEWSRLLLGKRIQNAFPAFLRLELSVQSDGFPDLVEEG